MLYKQYQLFLWQHPYAYYEIANPWFGYIGNRHHTDNTLEAEISENKHKETVIKRMNAICQKGI